MSNPAILYVSKALNPPFDDSGKVLPYLIAANLPDFRFQVPVNKGQSMHLAHVTDLPVFASQTAYKAVLRDKAVLFSRALFARSAGLLHFFFSPNPMGNAFGRLLVAMRRRIPSIQTIMSLPKTREGLKGALFADLVVVWSEMGQQWALAAAQGMPERKRPKIVHIKPGIEPLNPVTGEQRAALRRELGYEAEDFLVLYPGDLEFTDTAIDVANAATRFLEQAGITLIMAMRPKTKRSYERLDRVKGILAGQIHASRVRILGSEPRFRDLLRVCDLVILPAPSTYAKTDIPLAILEAMSAGVPAVVGKGSAMEELERAGVALAVQPNDPEGLAGVVRELYDNREGLSELSDRAMDYVKMHHTARVMARAFGRLYKELLSGNRR